LNRQSLFFPQTRRGRRLPAFAWAGIILILSSVPGDRYPEVNVPYADKWVHALLYVTAGFLFARAFHPERPLKVRFILPVLAGGAFGAFDELHQLLIPRRSCTMGDLIVDAVGVAAGTGIWLATLHGFQRRRRSALVG
jgi:VanZ family protein